MLNRIESLQDAFNRIWNHYIIKHHTFAYDREREVAVMQDAEGNKDPIRVLIPDNKFHKNFEMLPFEDIIEYRGLRKYFSKLKYEINFLAILTDIHDKGAEAAINTAAHPDGLRARRCYREFRRSFKEGLLDLAGEYDLNIPSSRPYPTYTAAKKKVNKKK